MRVGGAIFGGGGEAGGFTIVNKLVDETIQSDTTLADDNNLFWEVDANSVYLFFGFIKRTSGATPDWKHAFSFPAGGNCQGINAESDWNTPRPLTNYTSTAVLVGSGTQMQMIFGYVTTVGIAGICNYQWAQNTSDASDTTLNKGSWFAFKKVE